MECSINSPTLSLLMKRLVIGQGLKTSNFSAFHWSPRGSLVYRSHEGSTFTEKNQTSLITEMDQNGPNYQLLQLCTARTAGPIRFDDFR